MILNAADRGGPRVSLEDGRDLIAPFRGPASLVEQMRSREARPLALASADYDEDGVPALVCGHATDAGGIVTLYR